MIGGAPGRWGGALLLVVLAVLTSACGGHAAATESSNAESVAFSGEVPEFEGPYAAEFADFYVHSTSEFVRAVLADGEITDAEYAEMVTRLSECLDGYGVELQSIAPGAGMSTTNAPNGADTHEIINTCSVVAGENSIGALRDFMADNPDNADPTPLIVQCLVDSGTVPSDYGVEDFDTDSQSRFTDLDQLDPG